MIPGDRVSVTIRGKVFDDCVVVGFLPYGDMVVSVDGKSVAVSPRDIIEKEEK